MSQLMVSPGAADLALVDELFSISMLETTIVVRPTGRPDALGTQVFTDVVNVATRAGATVMLHRRDALVDSTVAIDVPTTSGACREQPAMAEPAGIGLLLVRSETAVWTIDFSSERFVRSDGPVDRLLLARSDWTAFEALWIAPGFVRALTMNGSFLTGRRILHRPRPADFGNDRQASLLLSHVA